MRTALPPTASSRARVSAPLLAVLSLLLLSGAVGPAPATAASVRDVQLTQDGPVPKTLTIGAGDSVRFVNTDTFVHRVVSDSSGWAFDSRQIFPGRAYTVPAALTSPGTYTYRGADLDSFTGSVLVPGAAASSPEPSPRASSAAPAVPVPGASPSSAPSASAAPAPSGSATPAPAATGGTGSVQGPPPLAGGSFGGFSGLGPTPAPGVPAPQVAPGLELPTGALPVATELPVVVPPADGAPVSASGDLPRLSSPVEARRYGLPLALATVLIGGVLSLLVRLLLAEAPARPSTA